MHHNSCNSLPNRQCPIEKELNKAHTECMRISRRFLPQRDPWHPNLFKPSHFPDACPGCWQPGHASGKFDTRSVYPPVSHSLRLFLFPSFRFIWQISFPLLILGTGGFLYIFKKKTAFYSIWGLLCCQHYPQWTLSLIVSLGLSVTPATNALCVFYLCSWAQWDSNGSAQTDWTPETGADQLSCLLWVSIVLMHA